MDKQKIKIKNNEQTSVDNIYAIGDCTTKNVELTPVAIKTGTLLALRLFGNSNQLMNYENIPTTVFTPVEYSCIGLSEEEAIKNFGEQNLEIYHLNFKPLEWEITERNTSCFIKVICELKTMKVLGFHLISPNSGEITQGIAISMLKGLNKNELDLTVGIHPTIAEVLTTLDITKRSGISPFKTGC